MRPNIISRQSKSYFDIITEAKYCILTFNVLFWRSNWGPISFFDIQNPILTFILSPNIFFWHSQSYFDIQTETEYCNLTFNILFWHSEWGRISNFDTDNPILTCDTKSNIVYWRLNPILTFETRPYIVFRHQYPI